MTPKSFWTIIIKIIGLYFLWQGILALPSMVMLFSSFGNNAGEGILYGYLSALGIAIVFFLFIRLCLFKAEWIVRLLKLDKGFGEEVFAFNFNHSKVLHTVIIIAGVWMVAASLPLLAKDLIELLRDKALYPQFTNYPGSADIAYHAVVCIIGLLIVSLSSRINAYLDKKTSGVV